MNDEETSRVIGYSGPRPKGVPIDPGKKYRVAGTIMANINAVCIVAAVIGLFCGIGVLFLPAIVIGTPSSLGSLGLLIWSRCVSWKPIDFDLAMSLLVTGGIGILPGTFLLLLFHFFHPMN